MNKCIKNYTFLFWLCSFASSSHPSTTDWLSDGIFNLFLISDFFPFRLSIVRYVAYPEIVRLLSRVVLWLWLRWASIIMCIFNLTNGQMAILFLSSAGGRFTSRHQHECETLSVLCAEANWNLHDAIIVSKNHSTDDECWVSRFHRTSHGWDWSRPVCIPKMPLLRFSGETKLSESLNGENRRRTEWIIRRTIAERKLFVIACSFCCENRTQNQLLN